MSYVLVLLWHTPGYSRQFPFHFTEHSYSNNTSNGCTQQDTSNEASNASTNTSTEAATCYVCVTCVWEWLQKAWQVHSYSLILAEWAKNMSNMHTHAHFSIQHIRCRTSQLASSGEEAIGDKGSESETEPLTYALTRVSAMRVMELVMLFRHPAHKGPCTECHRGGSCYNVINNAQYNCN